MMDLSNFKLLKEADDSYQLAHPSGKTFNVEKNGLSEKSHELIKKLKESNLYAESVILTGNNEWKELIISFRTLDNTDGGSVTVRRESTNKFDRLLSGTVWLDDIQLKEVE